MGAYAMPNRSWRALMEKKGVPVRKRAVWQIILTIRGRKVLKEYDNERDYKRWRETYEHQTKWQESGIQKVEVGKIYR